MTNRNENLEITKRLRLSSESEMSRDDLELMLEEELTKPEDEMDPELIQLILATLEDTPSSKAQRESWKQIEQKLSSKRQWLPAMNGLTRIAAIGVILVAVMFATYGTAQAFNWEFLLRLMRPFAETFRLYSGDSPTATPVPDASHIYGDIVLDITQKEFTTLEECPSEIAGYPIKPVWMPEQFAYMQGSLYIDALLTTVTHTYSSDAGFCLVDITILDDSGSNNAFEYEHTNAANTVNAYVAGYKTTFYYNNEGILSSASCIVDTAHYSITGNVTKDEIIRILEEMINTNGG